MTSLRRAPECLYAGVAMCAVLVLAMIALLASGRAQAQATLPIPALTARVIDQTGSLQPAQIDALTAKLAAIETQRGAQVVVLMVPTTQPEDIATYGYRVADSWKVGRRDVGDGLVIIVAKNDRRVNIEVARSLEGAVPDVLAGRVIADQIKPAFAAGDYAGGLSAAIDRLDKAIGGENLPVPSAPPHGNARGGGGFDLQGLGILLFVAVPVVGGLLSSLLGRKIGALLTGIGVGGLGFVLTTSIAIGIGAGLIALFLVGVVGLGGLGGGRFGGLGGGPVIWGGGRGGGGFGGGGGGGGFSSGGGGSFGGGGASGSW